MEEDVHVVLPVRGEDVLDLVVRLGHVALDADAVLLRERSKTREQLL